MRSLKFRVWNNTRNEISYDIKSIDNDPTARQLRKQLEERIEYLKSLNKVES